MREAMKHTQAAIVLALALLSPPALAQDEPSGGKESEEGGSVEVEEKPEPSPEPGEGPAEAPEKGPEEGPALAPGEIPAPGAGEEEAEVSEGIQASGQSVQRGEILFSSMGAAGLAVIDVSDPASPVVLQTLTTKSPVKVLQLMDDTLLVILDDFTVIPLDVSDPRKPVPKGAAPGAPAWGPPAGAGPAEAGPPPEPPAPPIEGKVLKADKGWVVLNVGKNDGVKAGMRFAIYGSESSKHPRAIVTIAKVTPNFSSAPLPPRGDAVKGDSASRTDATWKMKHWFSPHPEPGYLKLRLDFKPIVGAGEGAGTWGFLSNLELAYKFKAPGEIAFVMVPAGYGHSNVGKGAVFEMGAMGGVNWRYIGYTWGVGAHLSKAMKDHRAILLNKLRLGNDDGFHLEFFMTWAVPSDDRNTMQKVLPDTTIFTIDVPVRPKLNLYFELGGGNFATRDRDDEGSGWANFVLGVRTFLMGAGGSGTLILSTGMGLGYVWDQSPDDAVEEVGGSTWGMLLHLGLEWRI
jgi:hypothetical protein